MIVPAPNISDKNIKEAITILTSPEYNQVLTKIDDEYMYWDRVRYMIPKGIEPGVFWHAIKLKRNMNRMDISFSTLRFHFTVTGKMQQMLHEFDLNFGGSLGSNSVIPEKDHKIYLTSSIMEEAIASSQMEGASTTRRVAKDMLRKQMKPANKSQQMIANNYATIQYLVEHKDEDFGMEQLLNIHHLITNKTLGNPANEGTLRNDNNILVMDNINGETVHTPPPADMLENLVKALCDFANNRTDEPFIHPIIKGIIIHFMLAYFHPFADGNGRTARSLVYWYMLKNGYWLTEYLSISRVIYRSKTKYEKAYLYAEADGLDLSYFIMYNLTAMKQSYTDLKDYLQRKAQERQSLQIIGGDINERQSQIIQMFRDKPNILVTAKELTSRFAVSSKTLRNDLQHLTAIGLLEERPINRRTTGYAQAGDMEERLRER